MVYLRWQRSWLTAAVLVSLAETCLLTALSPESIRTERNYIPGLAQAGIAVIF